MQIGDKLKKIRIDGGFSQDVFSNIIGLKRANYSLIENNKQKPTLETLSKLARKFNVNLNELIAETTIAGNAGMKNTNDAELIATQQELIATQRELIATLKKQIAAYEEAANKNKKAA